MNELCDINNFHGTIKDKQLQTFPREEHFFIAGLFFFKEIQCIFHAPQIFYQLET